LALLSAGYSPDEVASLLRTSPALVLAHGESAAGRLGVATWREAVREARRRNLID
jgi:DNA-binding CsgD family transcriptional regulator